jgi:hypothetical protein
VGRCPKVFKKPEKPLKFSEKIWQDWGFNSLSGHALQYLWHLSSYVEFTMYTFQNIQLKIEFKRNVARVPYNFKFSSSNRMVSTNFSTWALKKFLPACVELYGGG